MLPKSHPYHIHTTPISHLHHPHPSYITLHPHHIITFTSHAHHIHITSSYLHHPHHIYITSIIISSHVHHQRHTYITHTSHPHHIKITSRSHAHHFHITPYIISPHWHHHYAQSHLMQNDKGISSHPKELCCSPVDKEHHITHTGCKHGLPNAPSKALQRSLNQ
jgi:hypothetical protein